MDAHTLLNIILAALFAFSAIWIACLFWAVLYNHYKTKSDMATIYATITIEFSKAGLHAICEDIEEDCFCTDGDLSPLEELINKAEIFCNTETRFTLAGRKEEDDGGFQDLHYQL